MPENIILLVFKTEKLLEMWFQDGEIPRLVATYPILGASGISGPKLIEGDKQVPEGFYEIETLNPQSQFYLSMRINYPNKFDQEMAIQENRLHPGSDIYLHGKNNSVGCLAMGDRVIEELFYIVALIGKEKVKVVISPFDFRIKKITLPNKSEWINLLYADIVLYLKSFNK